MLATLRIPDSPYERGLQRIRERMNSLLDLGEIALDTGDLDQAIRYQARTMRLVRLTCWFQHRYGPHRN